MSNATTPCARCGRETVSDPLPPGSGLYTGQVLCGGTVCRGSK